MNKLLLPALLLCCTHPAFAQKDTRARLDGMGNKLCITPSGAIWVATSDGQTYYTNDIQDDWHVGSQKCEEAICDIYERASFFNADTGMITGFISEYTGKYNIYYLTTNGGRSWEKKYFAEDEGSWIDAFYSDVAGHVWMSGSSQKIYYSNDFGASWSEKARIPHGPANLRLVAINFQTPEKGIVGSDWNKLYLTHNGGNNWDSLSTPLDQKCFKLPYKHEKPSMEDVLLFHNWILVKQHEEVFFTAADFIHWQPISGCRGFSYDPILDKLWLVDSTFHAVLMDRNMAVQWRSARTYPLLLGSIRAANGYLYGAVSGKVCRLNENGDYVEKEMFTHDIPIDEPWLKCKLGAKNYGADGRDLLALDSSDSSWYRVRTLPIYSFHLKPLNDSLLLVADAAYRYFLIHVPGGTLEPYQISHPLAHFLETPIDSVILENGSTGCFHNFSTTICYLPDKVGNFKVKQYNRSSAQGNFSKHYRNTFNGADLKRLLQDLDENPFQQRRLSDFQISPEDVANYHKIIKRLQTNDPSDEPRDLEYKYGLNLDSPDYRFYDNYADSIRFIPDSTLNEVLLSGDNYRSTTHNWVSMKIINRKGEVLDIRNSDFVPNAWQLPWTVNIDGLEFNTLQLDITRFILENSPGFIKRKNQLNDYLIFQMVDRMYRDKLGLD